MTLADKHALDEAAKCIEEIREKGGNGSVEIHVQNGQVRALKTNRCEVLQIPK